MVEHRLSFFLAIGQVLKRLWHFEILAWESMGKPKMWILSRKQLIVEQNRQKFGTRCITVHICRVLLMPDSLSLVWGHPVTLQNFQSCNFLKLCFSPSFHPIHPNFIQGIIMIQAVTFFAICQKVQKLWHFEIFLKQDNMQLEFSISPSKLCDNIGYHGESKCLLEYCNEKLASST